MSVLANILNKLREKGCIIQRGDGKWVGDWDEGVISPVSLEVMKSFGHVELVDRKRGDGTTYPAYVITDEGRKALEDYQAKYARKRAKGPAEPEK
jgi:predicted transcriptional regulator